MSKFKSASKSKFDELRKKLQEGSAPSNTESKFDNSWTFKPEILSNQTKSVYTIRFLPNVHINDGLDEPWLEFKAHMFIPKNSTKKTYQVCPTSKGDKERCPICERAKQLFDKGDEVSERFARAIYKKRRYYANVLVIKDPRKGDDNQEGKVLVWEFGKKILDKLTTVMSLHGLNFWDVEEGANFTVCVTKDGGFNNYDSSDFERRSSSLSESFNLDEIHQKIHNLEEKVFPRIRTYDELNDILNGKQVVDENTKDSRIKTVTRDTKTEESEEVEEPVVNVDKAFEVEEVEEESVKEKAQSKPKSSGKKSTTKDEDDIDISEIDFDADDPF
jgi:hypothetical protein